jgi:hypothetical protein
LVVIGLSAILIALILILKEEKAAKNVHTDFHWYKIYNEMRARFLPVYGVTVFPVLPL